ncbi:MAG: DeoR/GlpR transcriptional regulator, partial [Hyphomicrobiales bacterium]|nr:DeoR/GlpR transcriptional regulator [Hyphomicrobiales bacterium]
AAEQRHMMMKAGQKVYVVADHSKFERRTPVRMTPVSHIAGLIVDKPPPEAVGDALIARQWPVILAGA